MALELCLTFPDSEHVQVELWDDGVNETAGTQPFAPPLDKKTREELTWYLETYPVHYTIELDESRAASIAEKLKDWGRLLFKSAFADLAAHALYVKFKERRDPSRLLTVRSLHPMVLAQPWELLCDPNGTFLYLDYPPVSIRRRLFGPGETPYRPQPKDTLNLLFVVSRPDDEGFIDPRADPMAVLDAIDAEAPGRIMVEFLRPPTLARLIDRLMNDRLPPVDVLHFDGHGAYDPDERFSERWRQAPAGSGLVKIAPMQAHHGYLLLEDDAHKSAPVSAALLGDLLKRKQVGLVILSACRSAMVSGEDALGSVAPRLIRAGIPSVLAMTQSVLVATTRALAGHFYRELAAGRRIGEALDLARTKLYADPRRQRASGTIDLELQDWFVPALYQAGVDQALLTWSEAKTAPPAPSTHNLPDVQASGFFGRQRELHDIERWFVGGTRRIVLTGFGGQGKTALALEAGRWLLRSGLFEHVCFVTYAGFQGSDPAQLAVSTLETVLDGNLLNAEAAGTALTERATLLILDNLDSLEGEKRLEFLTAASAWSKQGRSRVLITARSGELGHTDYPAEGSNVCRHLELAGLSPEDALRWFGKLLALPPESSVFIPTPSAAKELLAQVKFHPLSISLLTPMLKRRGAADIGEALREQLLKTGNPLTASLTLSLNQLDGTSQTALLGFGVFAAGGALERALTAVLEIDEPHWRLLRDALSQARLVEIETTPSIDGAFIRFHPTLAAEMRLRLSPDALDRLSGRYCQCYFSLSCYLQEQISKRQNHQSVLWMAQRELSNLSAAVCSMLDRAEPAAVQFAYVVAHFMRHFGQSKDSKVFLERVASSSSVHGSEEWSLLARGEQLFKEGKYAESETVFEELLDRIDDSSSLHRCHALRMSAVCKACQGRLEPAEAILRQALCEAETLHPDREVLSVASAIHRDLGEILVNQGHPDTAQEELEAALTIAIKLQDRANIATIKGSVSHLLLKRKDLSRQARCRRAEEYAQAALTIFKDLEDYQNIAIGHHQLGVIHLEAGALSLAERDFREAARLSNTIGDWLGAGQALMELAKVCLSQEQPVTQVELWYRKALSAFDRANDLVSKGVALDNLAKLLCRVPERLDEARVLAEEALKIKTDSRQHESAVRETLELLGAIALWQGDQPAKLRYASALKQTLPLLAPGEGLRLVKSLVADIHNVLQHPAQRHTLERKLELIFRGSSDMIASIRAILDGERDENILCKNLDIKGAFMVRLILTYLAQSSGRSS
jgi:tetratricopeptide (TPR) repeat protein